MLRPVWELLYLCNHVRSLRLMNTIFHCNRRKILCRNLQSFPKGLNLSFYAKKVSRYAFFHLLPYQIKFLRTFLAKFYDLLENIHKKILRSTVKVSFPWLYLDIYRVYRECKNPKCMEREGWRESFWTRGVRFANTRWNFAESRSIVSRLAFRYVVTRTRAKSILTTARQNSARTYFSNARLN